jgi:hypothetical protein
VSSQYQDLLPELNTLYRTLQVMERLELTEENASHVNAIRGIALACQLPLRDFLSKLGEYEASPSPFSTQYPFQAAERKTQWAVAMDEDIKSQGHTWQPRWLASICFCRRKHYMWIHSQDCSNI